MIHVGGECGEVDSILGRDFRTAMQSQAASARVREADGKTADKAGSAIGGQHGIEGDCRERLPRAAWLVAPVGEPTWAKAVFRRLSLSYPLPSHTTDGKLPAFQPYQIFLRCVPFHPEFQFSSFPLSWLLRNWTRHPRVWTRANGGRTRLVLRMVRYVAVIAWNGTFG